MTVALMAGSFDPPTLGHLNVIQRAAAICDTLIIGVALNSDKSSSFNPDERVSLLKKIVPNRAEVVKYQGLTVDFVKQRGVKFLIRGLRPFSEVEKELQMYLANKKLGNVETLFLMPDPQFSHISSTFIREIAAAGHSLQDFIPAKIESEVSARLREQR